MKKSNKCNQCDFASTLAGNFVILVKLAILLNILMLMILVKVVIFVMLVILEILLNVVKW